MRAMASGMRTALLGAAALAAACWGPPAPDGAVCRDVIHRLCLPARCPATTVRLGVGDTCEFQLLNRTGCAAEEFTFPEAPGRDRVLECRLLLLRAGAEPDKRPDCGDVEELFEICPDVASFLGAVGP